MRQLRGPPQYGIHSPRAELLALGSSEFQHSGYHCIMHFGADALLALLSVDLETRNKRHGALSPSVEMLECPDTGGDAEAGLGGA